MALLLVWLLAIQAAFVFATSDSSVKTADKKSDRSGRVWHHPAPSPQTLQQHQQNQPAVYLQTSTNQPGDNSAGSDSNGGRNFEEQDKSAVPAASEQDFFARHYGYLNIHRFDPNFPYYDRAPFPRFPSPHTPRFGPGYRKDKYGHGYGYSCKHGDDCDEVRAANQIPPMPPPRIPLPPHHASLPSHHSIPPPYNNHFVDASAYSNSLPPFTGHPSYHPYGSGGLYPPSPARFNDLHMPLPHQMPSRFFHGRYLHDQEDKKDGDKSSDSNKE